MSIGNTIIFDLSLFEQIGLRLSSARKAAGFKTAKAFAVAHHIPYTTYSQHEASKRSIPVDTLIEYSQLLGMDPGWLLTGKGKPQDNAHHCDLLEESERASLRPIGKSIALVDVALFMKIFKSMTALFTDESVKISNGEIIEDCYIDMYNVLVATSGSATELEAILDLLMNSLKQHLAEKI